MRVIGGKYRGKRFSAPAGLEVRPTSDRLRETLFNILAPRIEGSRFLDLCAGTGAVGIEALSRGALRVAFIDRSRRSAAAIKTNLELVGIKEGAVVIVREAESALKRLVEDSAKFEIVFFDPPYASDIYPRVMGLLGELPLLSDDAIVIVEHRAKSRPEPAYGQLSLYRELKQGDSALAFYSVANGLRPGASK
jgi:16S rRNA (guanine(966)-N(2))-methyltransferase RsmD